LGDRSPLENAYGSARLDYYLNNGSVLSADGGAAQVQNEVFVTGIGRVQVLKAIKPYARVSLAADRYNIFGFWNSRTSIDPQIALSSGQPLEERSDMFHLEGQQNWNFQQERGRIVYGASYRNTRVNTSGTLMDPSNDDRNDDYYSGYGQVEYKLIPQLRIVGAARVDDGSLFDTQFSPKGALVFSPNESHSLRFSVSRAFQTPNYSEFFLRAAAAPPTGGRVIWKGASRPTTPGCRRHKGHSPQGRSMDSTSILRFPGTSRLRPRRWQWATLTWRWRLFSDGSWATKAVCPTRSMSRPTSTSTSWRTSSPISYPE
jgi:outer membrane receptor protein involved in Fe transport